MYEGKRVDEEVAALPASFLNASQQVWIQPDLNVTFAYMEEFQGYYPGITPLVLDQGFELMEEYRVWERPYHVLLKQGTAVFSGNTQALRGYLGQKSDAQTEGGHNQVDELLSANLPKAYSKPEV